jgi:hypothetical protein
MMEDVIKTISVKQFIQDIRHHQDTNDPRCYYNILQKYFLLKSGNGSNFLDKVIGKKCT